MYLFRDMPEMLYVHMLEVEKLHLFRDIELIRDIHTVVFWQKQGIRSWRPQRD